MTRPLLLDLFSCAGGAARGYDLAGFDVVGVDLHPQPRYPYPFYRGDALEAVFRLIDGQALRFRRPGDSRSLRFSDFDAVHASPPCHDHSTLSSRSGKDGTGNLLALTLELLQEAGLPWIVENVVGARPMPDPILLCGSMFDLETYAPDRGRVILRRHRLFTSSLKLHAPEHPGHPRSEQTIGVYGTGDGGGLHGWKGSFGDRQNVMRIDWMNRAELAQALPPAYTEYVGGQLLEALR